jgi:hypothetical protein
MYSSALNVHGVIQYKFAAMDEGKKLTEIPVSAIRSYEYFAERNFFYILTIRKKNPAQFRMILDDVRKNLKPSVSTLQFQRMVVVEKRYLQENFQAPLKLVDQRVLE